MPLEEHEPGQAFPGVIGRTTGESSPAWPRPVRTVPVVQGRTQVAHPNENLLREGFGHPAEDRRHKRCRGPCCVAHQAQFA